MYILANLQDIFDKNLTYCLLINSITYVDDFSVILVFLQIGLNTKKFVLSLVSMQVQKTRCFKITIFCNFQVALWV